MSERIERLCLMARYQIAWAGYTVHGTVSGFWPFQRWRVEASLDGRTYRASARSQVVALHRLMV